MHRVRISRVATRRAIGSGTFVFSPPSTSVGAVATGVEQSGVPRAVPRIRFCSSLRDHPRTSLEGVRSSSAASRSPLVPGWPAACCCFAHRARSVRFHVLTSRARRESDPACVYSQSVLPDRYGQRPRCRRSSTSSCRTRGCRTGTSRRTTTSSRSTR